VTEEHAYDLYELLGLEAEARLPEIKQAYRWLQKRCHPDIAGEVGHDMAILLNDAYATLSDPMRRAAYDAVSSPRIPLWRIPVHLCGPSAQQKNFWPFFKN
jgi:curved DNA-binding protein CbpA